MNSLSERPVKTAIPTISQGWRVLLFALFFISGFCGLLYQTVWLRLALASFGVITPVVSVVISVFMLGLGLGSWLAGSSINALRRYTGISALAFYGVIELVIASGAFAVPACFHAGEQWLLHTGQANSTMYLLSSAAVIAGSICLFSTAMGMTFPLVMAFIEELRAEDDRSFSFLYVANLAGAVVGTVTTALVLIEIFGFHQTLFIAAALNLMIGLVSIVCARSASATLPAVRVPQAQVAAKPFEMDAGGNLNSPVAGVNHTGLTPIFGNVVLFFTGFTSMAMEVIWTRQFAEDLGTIVYAFAMLLSSYLVATFLGSMLYRFDAKSGKVKSIATLLSLAGASAVLPAVAVCLIPGKVTDLFSVVPFSAVLGYLTPLLIDRLSRGRPAVAGSAYAFNVFGCVIGPLAAGYWLLPNVSHRIALLVMSSPYVLLFILARKDTTWRRQLALTAAMLAALLMGLICGGSDEFDEAHWQTKRDYVATVSCTGAGMGKRLYVNGVSMTSLTPICKFMAHLPMTCRDHKPSKVLLICFGMGTSYRSLLSWDADVTAVELVPSVPKSFSYFHDDAESVLRKKNGRIIIDDGRRFLNRTKDKYDVIVIDPPPPVQAAGSSLLYSRDFYRVLRQHLKPDGVLQTWYPQAKGPTLSAVARSLIESFPNVNCFNSTEGWGYHFLASNQAFSTPSAEQMLERMPPAAVKDLCEWAPTTPPLAYIDTVVSRKVDVLSLIDRSYVAISDDAPFNEYFFLRRMAHVPD
jgi:predicted membrane-bound spermidine synthase